METRPIDIKVLERTPELVKVKLPFVDVPVQMSHNFFEERIEKGYFMVQENLSGQQREDKSN